MAILKLSGLITKISGKIGGSVLGTAASGSYIKQNSYSQQHASIKQQLQRVNIYEIPQLWRSLTQAQRDLWIADTVNYPHENRVGDTVYYTGFTLYNWCNQNLRVLGLPVINVPGVYVAPVIPSLDSFAVTSGAMVIDYSANSINNSFVVYASSPRSVSLVPKLSSFLKIKIIPSTLVSDTFDFRTSYINVFRAVEIGEYVSVYIKAINKNTGAPSGKTIVLTSQRIS